MQFYFFCNFLFCKNYCAVRNWISLVVREGGIKLEVMGSSPVLNSDLLFNLGHVAASVPPFFLSKMGMRL